MGAPHSRCAGPVLRAKPLRVSLIHWWLRFAQPAGSSVPTDEDEFASTSANTAGFRPRPGSVSPAIWLPQ